MGKKGASASCFLYHRLFAVHTIPKAYLTPRLQGCTTTTRTRTTTVVRALGKCTGAQPNVLSRPRGVRSAEASAERCGGLGALFLFFFFFFFWVRFSVHSCGRRCGRGDVCPSIALLFVFLPMNPILCGGGGGGGVFVRCLVGGRPRREDGLVQRTPCRHVRPPPRHPTRVGRIKRGGRRRCKCVGCATRLPLLLPRLRNTKENGHIHQHTRVESNTQRVLHLQGHRPSLLAPPLCGQRRG